MKWPTIPKLLSYIFLLKKELDKDSIDLNLVYYDYSREAQGYLNLVHKQIAALGRVLIAIEEVANSMTSQNREKE